MMKSYQYPCGSLLLSILAQGRSNSTSNEKENHQQNLPAIECQSVMKHLNIPENAKAIKFPYT